MHWIESYLDARTTFQLVNLDVMRVGRYETVPTYIDLDTTTNQRDAYYRSIAKA